MHENQAGGISCAQPPSAPLTDNTRARNWSKYSCISPSSPPVPPHRQNQGPEVVKVLLHQPVQPRVRDVVEVIPVCLAVDSIGAHACVPPEVQHLAAGESDK